MLKLLSVLAFASSVLSQTIVNVSTASSLTTAISGAVTNTVINLADGTYDSLGTVSVKQSNVTIQAVNAGKVLITGTLQFNVQGNYVTFSGLQFVTGNIANLITFKIFGNYVTVQNCQWTQFQSQHYVVIQPLAQYTTIQYCHFDQKPSTVSLEGSQVEVTLDVNTPAYALIQYNVWTNMLGNGGDYGSEPIRIGDDQYSLMSSRSVIQYNYFYNTTLGDSETISVKSRYNIIRYNVFDMNIASYISFRNGDSNVAYGNIIIRGTGGFRVKQANNIFVYNNYIDATGYTSTASAAVAFVYFAGSSQPNNINNPQEALYGQNATFAHNTFVNVNLVDFSDPQLASISNIVFANNIFTTTSTTPIFSIASVNAPKLSFNGNVFNTADVLTTTTVPSTSGNLKGNPNLIQRYDGLYALTSTTALSGLSTIASANYPSILAITTTIPTVPATSLDDDFNILFDIDGNARPSSLTSKLPGCQQSATTTGVFKNLVLKRGPTYYVAPGDSYSFFGIASTTTTSTTTSSTKTTTTTTTATKATTTSTAGITTKTTTAATTTTTAKTTAKTSSASANADQGNNAPPAMDNNNAPVIGGIAGGVIVIIVVAVIVIVSRRRKNQGNLLSTNNVMLTKV